MTLHELLDDVARDEPVVVDASAAWAAGRARRQRRLPRVLAAVAALLGVLALVVPAVPLTTPGFARAQVVGGYPEGIGRQAWVRDLPDRPGPVAALVSGQLPGLVDRLYTGTRRQERLWDGGPRWHAVTASGTRYRVPGAERAGEYPVLSPDGTRLGLLEGRDGPYVVHDLVTGERTRFPDLGANRGDSRAPYFVPVQTPGHWSPDGDRLSFGFSRAPEAAPSEAVVLDVPSGTLRALPSRGALTGWLDDDTLLWAASPDGDRAPVTLVATDLAGRVLTSVPLRPEHGFGAPTANQYTTLSGDGRSVVFVASGTDGADLVRWFDRQTGAEAVPPVPQPDDDWRLLAPVPGTPDVVGLGHEFEQDDLAVRLSPGGRAREVSRVDQALGVSTVVWASEALAGEPRRALLPWWGLPAGGALVLGLAWRRLRRWRRS